MREKRTFFHCMKGNYFNFDPGELAERSIAAVLKTVEVLQPPGVRIPNSPLFLSVSFSALMWVL